MDCLHGQTACNWGILTQPLIQADFVRPNRDSGFICSPCTREAAWWLLPVIP